MAECVGKIVKDRPALARRLTNLASDLDSTAEFLPPRSWTFGATARRSFETAYWKMIAMLSEGRYLTKNNGDIISDPVTAKHVAHATRDLEIPDDVRQQISERLTPGSSLIIGDTSVDTAILPEGDDFLVWANETPNVSAVAERPKANPAHAKFAKAKEVKLKRPQTAQVATKTRIAQKARNEGNWERAAPRYLADRPRRFRPWLFSRW